jgi:hypothetical protein
MRGHMMMILASQMVEYYRETSVRPVDLREKITLASNSVLDKILFRAVERGEISSQPLPARLKHLPFDLLRSEFFMTWQQPDKSKIVEIVDMIVIPTIEYQQKLLMDEAMRTYALPR